MQAYAGDALALKVVDETAYYLALGCTACLAVVDPQMIVIGGGVAAAGDLLLGKVREYVLKYGLTYPASRVQITHTGTIVPRSVLPAAREPGDDPLA